MLFRSLGSIEVLKRFVEIGLGVAIVPQVAVEAEVERGSLRAVQVDGLSTGQVGIIERRHRRRSAAAAAFIELIQQQLAGKKV